MVVFECVACGAALTVPLRQVDRPDHGDRQVGNGIRNMPALMEPGTYAAGSGQILLAPGDVRGMVWIPEQFDGYCCGLDAHAVPNLACECGQQVATRVDDCSLWQVVMLRAGAVRPAGDPEPVADWEAFDWSQALRDDTDLWWHHRLAASAEVALAQVVAAAGMPLTMPDGPLADVFRQPLGELLPDGPRAMTLALAGPGLAAGADVLLVPRHPQTGEAWEVEGTVVPISAELWRWLACTDEQPVIPATGGRWPYLDEDPLPRRPERLLLNSWLQ
ncbi:hypothetical protein SAMN04488564_109244 [Lentzea waywayandensis]|uniref:Uncharacterized protein n=1 Tax=Lentzea waywayandensis TaxID=84724 RepID=A0A1I6F8G6_9PSEU|nr:hypothetical protein [Lentzea waywayandensis]SFR26093.1 hypothetical protein SAMN04488564_109244 [Lentzea waywayandensis]